MSLLRIVLNQISHRARQGVCEGYLALGRPLPPRLRTFYISKVLFGGVYHTSAQQYQPVPYKSSLVFFRSQTSTDTQEAFWGSLVDGELKVYNVPGSHLGMLEEPNIQVLADQLKTCLEEASTAAGRMAVLSVTP